MIQRNDCLLKTLWITTFSRRNLSCVYDSILLLLTSLASFGDARLRLWSRTCLGRHWIHLTTNQTVQEWTIIRFFFFKFVLLRSKTHNLLTNINSFHDDNSPWSYQSCPMFSHHTLCLHRTWTIIEHIRNPHLDQHQWYLSWLRRRSRSWLQDYDAYIRKSKKNN